nr:endocuticle structural glycoprotein SgAbd-2-like [Penaeus vannamei]
MAAWMSLALLSVLTVSTLSLPRPDESAYRIPQVGTGRRSQYYVLHSDGTYKYGHDTGEGAFESARSSTPGQQRGSFGYVAPDGKPISLHYEAGEGGFVPQGAHLPATHPDFESAHAQARAALLSSTL